MTSGTYNGGIPNYRYNAHNTISYSKYAGSFMCTGYLDVYICFKDAGCAAGQYMNGNSCANCPRGRYRSSCCGTHYTHCSVCPAGRYGSSTGLTSSNCNGNCYPGHYCSAGSESHVQYACPAGRYGSSYGLTNSNWYVLERPCYHVTLKPCVQQRRLCRRLLLPSRIHDEYSFILPMRGRPLWQRWVNLVELHRRLLRWVRPSHRARYVILYLSQVLLPNW